MLSFAFAGLLLKAHAVIPPPDGGYPGGNTAEGQNALLSLTTGGFNTAVGWLSLRTNTEGSFNTALGAGTLFANTTAPQNTATGAGALLSNTTGGFNTANGAFALVRSTVGNFNAALGHNALAHNISGGENTAIGRAALFSSTGDLNIALGASAGQNLTTGDNNIDIGNVGVAGESDTIRIGASQDRTFIAGIRGIMPPVGVLLPVQIDLNGQLGTTSSSQRFKHEIKPMDRASEAIHALRPVTFHYTEDASATPQFGLIAEEVAEISPDLVVRDQNGELHTVRYDAVNAMLLNEFLKEHRAVQELKSMVVKQEADAAQQRKQIEALAAGLQKVTAELELSRPAPKTVRNNP